MAVAASPIVENSLSASAQYVKGVGPQRFEKLLKLGLMTVGDLLNHLPRSYEVLTNRQRIADLKANDETQTIIGEVVEIMGRVTATGKEMVSIIISDGGPVVLEAIYFNQSYIANQLRYGQIVACSGKPKRYRGYWQMNGPRIRPADEAAQAADGEILPVYALTDGLHADAMRRIQRGVVERYSGNALTAVPETLIQRHALMPHPAALRAVHLPDSMSRAEAGRRTLAYEELLVLQVALAWQRRDQQKTAHATPLPLSRLVDERIRRLFPFKFTRGQDRAVAQICRDLAQDRPMRRLLQADVGAGKTAVAVYAMLLAVANKHQTALMAPTEVLARQHWQTLNHYLARSRVKMELLVGGMPAQSRRIALADIRRGHIDLVVGTQALIQQDVEFARLGLVVIDEQHRFGVRQRAIIRHKGLDPHYLVMTATPIPRSIALTVFGDLDITMIRDLPPGRRPVVSKLVSPDQRDELMRRLKEKVQSGRQLLVVCPLVEESAESDLKGAIQTAKTLQDGPFQGLRVGLLHGRLRDQAKEQVVGRFRDGQIDVLVATTVVEVGVDIPGATLMLIEHGERFGLSQLHQLRGRISRGKIAGECYLFADASTPEAWERLNYFVKTTDGFALAEKDLALRGTGQFFGTRQHGPGDLRIAHPIRDAELLDVARRDAAELIRNDPQLLAPAHARLRAAVLHRYQGVLGLAEIG